MNPTLRAYDEEEVKDQVSTDYTEVIAIMSWLSYLPSSHGQEKVHTVDNPDKIEVALKSHFQKWLRYLSMAQAITISHKNLSHV